MKKTTKKLYLQEKKRYLKKIFGKKNQPRLAIFRSNKHIYAQLIDDENGKTLAFSSTLKKPILNKVNSTSTKEASFLVGEDIAKAAQLKEIKKIVFDRGNRPYHGRIESLAEGARNQGLIF
jgi:large subunit ribosomal protein L18